MIRRAVAVVLALALTPATLHAQDLVFSVSASPADVHKGPSIGTPVIGHVSSGKTMPVVRNLGSWVKVEWPGGVDGFGYLHVSTGQLGVRNGNTPVSTSNATARTASSVSSPASSAPTPSAASSSSSSSSSSSNGQTTMAPRPRPARERVVIRSGPGGDPISHVVGLGGLFGSMDSFGATGRVWRDNRLGLQVAFARDEMKSSAASGHVTSMQVEPAVVYGLFDRVGDYFWIRPYVGSGVSIRHQTLHDATPAGGAASTSSGVGLRVFGGGEVTFAGAPRFALSVDAGYRRFSTPFPGFEPDRFTAFVSGHWYVK